MGMMTIIIVLPVNSSSNVEQIEDGHHMLHKRTTVSR